MYNENVMGYEHHTSIASKFNNSCLFWRRVCGEERDTEALELEAVWLWNAFTS